MYWNQCRFLGYIVVKYLPLKSNKQRGIKAQLDVLIIVCTCKDTMLSVLNSIQAVFGDYFTTEKICKNNKACQAVSSCLLLCSWMFM